MLARAVRENRILLTFDKDFGEIAWGAGLPASCGIVLFRFPMPSPAKVGTVGHRARPRSDEIPAVQSINPFSGNKLCFYSCLFLANLLDTELYASL
ncbi:MAG: DUF5615 family PIN-like protein [Gammaproteobacteria bacterium]